MRMMLTAIVEMSRSIMATGMVDLAVVAWIAASWRALLALDGSTLAVLGALLSSLAVMVGYWTG